MKNTKWIWRILAILLTLVVLAGVGFAGFRVGVMQGANLTANGATFLFHHGRGFDGGMMRGDYGMQGFEHGHEFGGRNDFGRGGFRFFSPLFGLFHLAIFGGLIWLGYTLIKRSGWRVVNVNTSQPAVPVATPSIPEDEERKDEA